MSNNEKYLKAFIESLGVNEAQIEGLKYMGTAEWDSVGHMGLITAIEDEFDIMLDTDDIIDFSSFEKGKEILRKYDVEFD